MIELKWIDYFPENRLEVAFPILDKLGWSLTVSHYEQHWYVYASESLIFKTDSKEALDSFLYGIGLTYICYDPVVTTAMEVEIKKLLGEDQ